MPTNSHDSSEPEYCNPTASDAHAEISSRIATWESTTLLVADPWTKLAALFTGDLFRQRLVGHATVRQILTGPGTAPARLLRAERATKELMCITRRINRLLSIQLARDLSPTSKS